MHCETLLLLLVRAVGTKRVITERGSMIADMYMTASLLGLAVHVGLVVLIATVRQCELLLSSAVTDVMDCV